MIDEYQFVDHFVFGEEYKNQNQDMIALQSVFKNINSNNVSAMFTIKQSSFNYRDYVKYIVDISLPDDAVFLSYALFHLFPLVNALHCWRTKTGPVALYKLSKDVNLERDFIFYNKLNSG